MHQSPVTAVHFVLPPFDAFRVATIRSIDTYVSKSQAWPWVTGAPFFVLVFLCALFRTRPPVSYSSMPPVWVVPLLLWRAQCAKSAHRATLHLLRLRVQPASFSDSIHAMLSYVLISNTALSIRKTRARTFFSRSCPRRAWPRSPCTSRCTCGSTATMRRSWCNPRCATGGYSCFSARWR